MKKIGLLAAASLAALSVGGALAADLPSRKEAERLLRKTQSS